MKITKVFTSLTISVILVFLVRVNMSHALVDDPEQVKEFEGNYEIVIQPNSFAGNELYFTVVDQDLTVVELWKSDGSEEGTEKVTNLGIEGESDMYFIDPILFDDIIYFTNYDEEAGVGLWRTDGTSSGTYLLKDLDPTSDNNDYGYSTKMHASNDNLYFQRFRADDDFNGGSLWKTDGTEEGTELVKYICLSGEENPITSETDLFYFHSFSCEAESFSLWMSNGTTSGTEEVKNIDEQILQTVEEEIVYLGGYAYFQARISFVDGYELWKTDGTPVGTEMVKDIRLAGSSNPQDLTVFDDQLLFFNANDGSGSGVWKTDGTTEGTSKIFAESSDSFIPFNDQLYFSADDILYRTNGDDPPEEYIQDVSDSILLAFDEYIFFGKENALWKNDGTLAGTSLVLDDEPYDSVTNENLMYVLASDDTKYSLWKISKSMPTPTATIAPTTTPTVGISETQLVINKVGSINVEDGVVTYYYDSNTVKFEGTTHPLAVVKITVNSDPQVCETTADSQGYFECTFEYIEDGLHTVTITATTVDGEVITYPQMTLGINVVLVPTGNALVKEPLVGLILMSIGLFLANGELRSKLKNKLTI